MRKIKDMANNGQSLNEIVDLADLTAEEMEMLHIPATNKIEDYVNFQVRHNKKGELLGVKGHDFTVEKATEIEENGKKVNILDVYVALGDSETPIKRRDRRGAKNKLERNGVLSKAKRAFNNSII